MPALKSLAFTAMPKTASDPVHIRRAKFIEKLEEQKLLLQDPAYIRTVQRMAEVDGQKQPVCQSALEWDPLSASKRDPFDRRVLLVALAASELAGVAETARARV